ncbi:type B 50S ribosomal protein L31 [Salinicola halophyticus]|uniref:type B 50S ribosomal protein L31 n=1 Tax=Salinicola halophyticus TaxID=1808881 RepID=UPI000DA15F6E|nr:type B 50S ribosomal protein L31 [Salinicola halophyticus]
MKDGIHPDYRQIIFHDTSVNEYFKIGSTMTSDETIEWEDGNTYPLVHLDISSASHPFYTGKQREVGTEGRAAQFKRRFGSIAARRQS